jgi:transcriptional regulator PpsR
MERGYWQTRLADARYRLLLEVATDAMIVVNGETLHIVDANHAATELLSAPLEQLRGRHINSGFEHHSRGAVNELLSTARATGQSGEIRARLQGTRTSTSVVATPFRTDAEMRLLVRMRAIDADTASAARDQSLSHLVDDAPDGVVVTDSSGRVMVANPAFLKLALLTSETQLKGLPLAGWVSLADQPLTTLVVKVRQDGMARHLESWVNRDAASAVQIEIAAVLLAEGDQECIGFTFRRVARAAGRGAMVDSTYSALDAHSLSMALRTGIETLSAQVGERDVTELMRDATALVEQHFLALTLRRSAGHVGTA